MVGLVTVTGVGAWELPACEHVKCTFFPNDGVIPPLVIVSVECKAETSDTLVDATNKEKVCKRKR